MYVGGWKTAIHEGVIPYVEKKPNAASCLSFDGIEKLVDEAVGHETERKVLLGS